MIFDLDPSRRRIFQEDGRKKKIAHTKKEWHLEEGVKSGGIFKGLQIFQYCHKVRKIGYEIRVEAGYWQALTVEGTKLLESVHNEVTYF